MLSCLLDSLSQKTIQTSNDLAIQFYTKRGFEIAGTMEGYYKNIDPADAYILEKKID